MSQNCLLHNISSFVFNGTKNIQYFFLTHSILSITNTLSTVNVIYLTQKDTKTTLNWHPDVCKTLQQSSNHANCRGAGVGKPSGRHPSHNHRRCTFPTQHCCDLSPLSPKEVRLNRTTLPSLRGCPWGTSPLLQSQRETSVQFSAQGWIDLFQEVDGVRGAVDVSRGWDWHDVCLLSPSTWSHRVHRVLLEEQSDSKCWHLSLLPLHRGLLTRCGRIRFNNQQMKFIQWTVNSGNRGHKVNYVSNLYMKSSQKFFLVGKDRECHFVSCLILIRMLAHATRVYWSWNNSNIGILAETVVVDFWQKPW